MMELNEMMTWGLMGILTIVLVRAIYLFITNIVSGIVAGVLTLLLSVIILRFDLGMQAVGIILTMVFWVLLELLNIDGTVANSGRNRSSRCDCDSSSYDFDLD